MKTNGIVRKLDGLGRIVIPREYRKMHNIRVSDPLGIFALDNGDIVIRKVDMSASLKGAGEVVVRELADACQLSVLLTDEDVVLSAVRSGDMVGQKLTGHTRQLIGARKCMVGSGIECGIEAAPFAAVCPVFDENVFGAIILMGDAPIPPAAQSMLRLASRILGSSMQRF